MRVCVCHVQVPFVNGGAEVLSSSLLSQLKARGFDAEMVQLPFRWYPHHQLLKSSLAWRLLNLNESDGRKIDLLIATKFPSYLAKHDRKVVWLVHQHRPVYDLKGTLYGLGSSVPDSEVAEVIGRMDHRTLTEARAVYSIAQNVANRLRRYNGIEAETLYPPPKLIGRYRCDGHGDYIFAPSRLVSIKRLDVVVRAMAHVRSPARCLIAGTGPEEENLRRLIDELGLQDRVRLLGHVTDEEMLELYGGCLAVAFVPLDEDYGYVTVEAMASRKPVLTLPDAGGVLEFVRDGVTGYVCPAGSEGLAQRIDQLFRDRARARKLGEAAYEAVQGITWDTVIEKLTSA